MNNRLPSGEGLYRVHLYAPYLSTKLALYFVVIRRQGCFRKCIVSAFSDLQAAEYLTSTLKSNIKSDIPSLRLFFVMLFPELCIPEIEIRLDG